MLLYKFFYVSLCMLVSRLRYSFFLAMLVIYRSLHTLSNRKITILLFWFTSLKSIKLLYNKLNKFVVYDTWLVCTPNRTATEEPKEVLTFFFISVEIFDVISPSVEQNSLELCPGVICSMNTKHFFSKKYKTSTDVSENV